MSFFTDTELTDAVFLGRVWRPEVAGPALVTIRNGQVIDITDKSAPTARDICELDNPASYVAQAPGQVLGTLEAISTAVSRDPFSTHFLAPCDLQAVKACGVTFAKSMVERVIEEHAAGDA